MLTMYVGEKCTRLFIHAIVYFSGMRSCGDINDLKFIKFAEMPMSNRVETYFINYHLMFFSMN